MPGFLVHVGATASCPHQGRVTVVPTNTRVFVGTNPVATLRDTFPIAGCVFTLPNGKPQPCMTVRWIKTATRVFVQNQPAILQDSQGLCLSAEQVAQGPPTVAATQTKVMGA
jgi:Domain of unknown function (DUF4280)